MIKARKQTNEEVIRSRIKDLFESYGYEEYKMRMFEKYSLYLTHKDFLVSDKVITFTDLGGELLALRPDVTLSIVKNTGANRSNTEKLYYCENVYREDKQNSRFREINQLGLELIGSVGKVEIAETVSLALGALDMTGREFVLELSHVDFVASLFSACGFDEQTFAKAKSALNSGSSSAMAELAAGLNLEKPLLDKLCGLTDCSGKIADVLPKIKKLIANDEMQAYYDDISALHAAVKDDPLSDKLRFDFSLTAEENYYNGIIMCGFVRGVPKPVLSGGQYDKLLIKLEKNAQAIGFAVYLGELAPYLDNESVPVDVLLVYGDLAADRALAKARRLRSGGLSVRLAKNLPAAASYKEIIYMEEKSK